ncbi:MAG: hypothetical protein QOF48_1913 [Verrucomicrobiota bacterium]|jgi:hypothetical protein
MHDHASFQALIDTIKALGYDDETAGDFAVQIGDTPCVDDSGRVIVTDAAGRTVRLPADLL